MNDDGGGGDDDDDDDDDDGRIFRNRQGRHTPDAIR